MGTTVRDIAEAANLSIGTVSRALRGVPGVRQEHAERIRRAAEQMRYKRQSRRTIAMVLLGIDQSLSALPVIANALQGAEAAISASGGTLLLASCPDLAKMPASLQKGEIDGLILNGALEGTAVARADTPLMRRLREIPSVWLLARPEGVDWGDVVSTDNSMVGKIAAEHLVSRGHTRLGFISSMIDHPAVSVRQLSFVAHARATGAAVDAVISQNTARLELPERTTAIEDVEALLDRLLALSPRPTGIFAPFDHLGSVVHRGLARRGIAIGRDIDLISCNNERELLDPLTPQPATIDIHARTIGRKATELLHWRFNHLEDAQTVTWSIKPRLVTPI